MRRAISVTSASLYSDARILRSVERRAEQQIENWTDSRSIQRKTEVLRKKRNWRWSIDADNAAIRMCQDNIYTLQEIARVVSDIDERERSENAVRKRLLVLGYVYVAPGIPGQKVASMLGISLSTLRVWCKDGRIHARKLSASHRAQWVILYPDLLHFIKAYPGKYDWTLIKDKRLKQLAEVVWKSSGLVTVREAAAILRVSTKHVHWYVKRYGLQHTVGAFDRSLFKRADIYALSTKILHRTNRSRGASGRFVRESTQ